MAENFSTSFRQLVERGCVRDGPRLDRTFRAFPASTSVAISSAPPALVGRHRR
jgi:hypothetical protein